MSNCTEMNRPANFHTNFLKNVKFICHIFHLAELTPQPKILLAEKIMLPFVSINLCDYIISKRTVVR